MGALSKPKSGAQLPKVFENEHATNSGVSQVEIMSAIAFLDKNKVAFEKDGSMVPEHLQLGGEFTTLRANS